MNAVMAVILRYSTEFGSFGANCVKVVESRSILFATEIYSSKNLVLAIYTYGNILRGF